MNETPDVIEQKTLRHELRLHILLQNTLLIVSVCVFATLTCLAVAIPHSAGLAAVACSSVIFANTLQWCHHGIRTRQIKMFLLLGSESDADATSWEHWLPKNRPQRLLGSRWMISTKGVFLGLDLAMKFIAFRLTPSPNLLDVVPGFLLLAATAGFLFTNPKE